MGVTFHTMGEDPKPKVKRGKGGPKKDESFLPLDMTWELVKHIFIHRNLNADLTMPVTYAHLAAEFGISESAIKYHAAKEKWTDLLASLRKERESVVKAMHRVYEVIPEMQVRARQAEFARVAAQKALERIQDLDAQKLTVKEAVLLLRLGLQEERRAMGIPDVLPQGPNMDQPPINGDEGGTVEQAVRDHEEIKSLGMSLMDFAKRRLGNLPPVSDAENVTDVEPK